MLQCAECVLLCEVLNAGGSAVLRDVRLVGGDACGIVCRVLARGSGKWLGRRVLGACAALRRRGVGPPFSSTWVSPMLYGGTWAVVGSRPHVVQTS